MNIAFGLLAALAAGTSDFLGGLGSRRLAAVLVATFAQLSGMVVALAMTTVIDGELLATDLMWGALAGMFGATGLLSIYIAYSTGRVAVAAPVAGVGTAAIPVVVSIVRGSDLTTNVAIGIGVGLVAIALTSLGADGGEGSVVRSLAFGAGGAVGLGLLLLLLAEGSEDGGLWPLVAARGGGFVALSLVVTLSATTWPRPASAAPALPFIAGIAVLGTIANALFIIASRNGSTAVAAVLVSLFPAATVIWAWIVLKEPLRRVQMAGIALALVAIALIAA